VPVADSDIERAQGAASDLGSEESSLLELYDRAFTRTAGSPLIGGNAVRLLRDAAEHFPAWLAAIRAASRTILFESYMIHDDEVGREFIAALAAKARDGVRVRVVYDWLGSRGASALWEALRGAGAQVRAFNPFRVESPLGWLSRDHRKTIAIDGRIGFVSGVCVSANWNGDPERRFEPWRDTGIEIVGPAVAELEQAFAQVWIACGGAPLAAADLAAGDAAERAGDVAVRVISGTPSTAGVFRLDQVVAATAQRYLWLTDAYFVGLSPYVQALCAAARDGVDVRLLVPGATDLPALQALSRTGYRPLLAAGVRVFEWNGTMLHAKTAVADGMWARVGSTNLNFASWVHNWELDVAIEDRGLAEEMAAMYVRDLANATEIVLTRRNRVRRTDTAAAPPRVRHAASGSAGRAAAGALSVGSALGAALTNRRVLGPAESGLLFRLAAIALGVSGAALVWPRLLAIPLAIVGVWLGVAMLGKAWMLRRQRRRAQARASAGEAAPNGRRHT
jgi:cardiolipin synthase